MSKLLVLLTLLLLLPATGFPQELNQVDDQGMKQGKWRKTYTNGAIRYEGQFKNNNPYGTFKHYYESTVLKAITIYSDDGVIARTKTFHENGNKMAEGKFTNQIKDSIWHYFSDVDGVLIAEENYFAGDLNGKSISYFPESGITAELIEYKDGKKDGLFLKYFPNGKLLSEGIFINDQLEGSFTVYYSDGSIELKGDYKAGRKIGNWSYYNEEGLQLTEDEYKKETEPQ